MRAVLVLMLLLTTPSLAELRPVTRAVTVNPTNAALWFPDAEQFGAANEFVRRVESDGGITVFSSGTVVRLHVDIPDVSEFLTQSQADLLYQEIGAWTAASGSVVYATTPGYTAAVEQAASAYGWGDHSAAGYLTEETDTAALSAVAAVSGRVDTVEGWGDHSAAGYATTKAAGDIATNVVGAATNALLDLAGTRAMTGNLDMGGQAVTNALTIASPPFTDLTLAGFGGTALNLGDYEAYYGSTELWLLDTGTNVWQGRVNDAESSRIAALAEGAGGGNLTATNTPTRGQMLYASGTDNATLYWDAAPEGGGTGGTSTNEVRAIRDEAFRPYTTLGLSGGTALVTRASGQWVMIEADDGEVTLDVDVAAYTNSLEAIRHQICWVRGTNETYTVITNNIDNTLFVDLPASTTNHLFLERRPGWPRFQIWQDFR